MTKAGEKGTYYHRKHKSKDNRKYCDKNTKNGKKNNDIKRASKISKVSETVPIHHQRFITTSTCFYII